jgi:ATP-dependent exoDNAse (exonuclease V) beta subunit
MYVALTRAREKLVLSPKESLHRSLCDDCLA